MDYVYGELGAEDTGAMKQHAAGCSACRSEVEAVSVTREYLGAWNEEPPPVVWVAPRESVKTGRRWLPVSRRRWLAVAAVLGVVFLGVLLAMGTTIRFRDGAMEVRIGRGPGEETAARQEERLKRLVAGMEENQLQQATVIVNQMIADSEERQMQRVLDLLQNVYLHLELQRRGKSPTKENVRLLDYPQPRLNQPGEVAVRQTAGSFESRDERNLGVHQ